MKLIKAFVRTTRGDEVVRALEGRCAGDHHLEVSKIEVVCCAPDVECLVEALVKAAHTGVQGDGIVFVTPVERAIKIRTGDLNSLALTNSGGISCNTGL